MSVRVSSVFEVELGCAPHDVRRHCSDGDSPYVTISARNSLIRLLGVDAPETSELNLDRLRKSGFLETLDGNLRRYVEPRLTATSVKTHRTLGVEAGKFLETVLRGEITMALEREVFDRYGRMLAEVFAEDELVSLKMVESGYAVPHQIYPNAASPTEEGFLLFSRFYALRRAAAKAHKKGYGIWPYLSRILLPMEVRFLMAREIPLKYCAAVEKRLLYSPQHYFKVPVEDRLFFYQRDVLQALLMGFSPATDCEKWLHGVRATLQREKKVERK